MLKNKHLSRKINAFFIVLALDLLPTYDSGMKGTYKDVIISAVDDSFDQWVPNTATPMEEVYGRWGGLC